MKKFPFALAIFASLCLLGCSETSSASVSSSAWSLTSYPDSGIYAVSTYVPTGHGRLSSSKKQAEAGLSITITVTAESGYVLENIFSEQVVLLEVVLGTTYSFIMPAENVSVTASFVLDTVISSALL